MKNTEKFFIYGIPVVRASMNNQIYWIGNTLSLAGIHFAVEKTQIRGGEGNAVQFVGNHSTSLTVEATDVQFKMATLAMNTGTAVTATGGNIWTTSKIVVANNVGTLEDGSKTPVPFTGELDAYLQYDNGTSFTNFKMNVDGKTCVTSGLVDGTYCVDYLYKENNATQVVIPANAQPDVVRLDIIANVYSSSDGAGKRGTVTITIDSFKLDGKFDMELKPDGGCETSISGEALSRDISSAESCEGLARYATITQFITTKNVFDDAVALAIVDGDFSLAVGKTKKLQIYAIGLGGANLGLIPNTSLTFASGTAAKASVGANTGIVTGVTAGDSLVTVKITAKPTIEASCTVTVTA